MTLADLSSLGSFVSGVAVLASLVFVGYQLRQNTQAVRAAASQAHSANYHSLVSPLSENAGLASIWLRGLSHYEDLSNEDRARFIMYTSGAFRFFESSRVQWRHGQLDNEHWQNVEANVRDFASQPGIGRFWRVRKHWHSTEFQNWFGSLSAKAEGGLYDSRDDTDERASATD
jgi:hypothetical protein